MRTVRSLLLCSLISVLTACDRDEGSVETFRCAAAPPFGYEVHPTEIEGYEQEFMFTRGQLWLSVDADCVVSVWQGHGRFAEMSRPLAERQLTAEEYGDLRARMGVDAWDAHSDAEFQVEDDDAYLGARYRFLSGDRAVECTRCAPWLYATLPDLTVTLEEVYVEAAPVSEELPLYAGTLHWYWKTDPGALWFVPWELEVGPEAFELSEVAGSEGALATADQATWLRSVRRAFLDADRGNSTQSAPFVEYEGGYHELFMREW